MPAVSIPNRARSAAFEKQRCYFDITYLRFIEADPRVHQSPTETTSVICSDCPCLTKTGPEKGTLRETGKQKCAKICPIAGQLEIVEKMVEMFRKRIKYLRFIFPPLEVATAFNPLQMSARLSGVLSSTSTRWRRCFVFQPRVPQPHYFVIAPKIKSH